MTLTKTLHGYRCRKCICCIIRRLNSQANAGPQKVPVHLRKMSVNQWKLIGQIKEHLSDKGQIMHVIKREWTELTRKLPALTAALQAQEIATSPPDTAKLTSKLYESVQLLNDWKSRFGQKVLSTPKLAIELKWRGRHNKTVSTESIISRTHYLISALKAAKTDESTSKRLADFTLHLLEYPESAGLAVKGQAVRVLLGIRRYSKNEEVIEAAQEALSMVGYADPPMGRGIRILSIDGGGVRGLLVIAMLRRLEELTNRKVYEMFDYICGVSTGSILACTIGASGKSLDEIAQLYKILSTKIFTQNAFEGVRSLLFSHGYYDSQLWEKTLQEHVGDTTFHQTARKRWCPKIGAVSTVIDQGHLTPFVFRNYNLPYRVRSQYPGSHKYKLWEATRASAAAPAYFGEFQLDKYSHQDGGLLANNPTAVALHEARLLWPKTKVQCVVSCGTGRINPTLTASKEENESSKQSSWQDKFAQIVTSATDTEAVHTIMSDLLPSSRYYRFNPYLTEMLSMVEYQPEKLAQLEQDAAMYIRRNDEKFAEAAEKLTETKPFHDKMTDWVALQTAIYRPF